MRRINELFTAFDHLLYSMFSMDNCIGANIVFGSEN